MGANRVDRRSWGVAAKQNTEQVMHVTGSVPLGGNSPDCEDSLRSPTAAGCGSVTASVTLRLTGLVPLRGFVRSWLSSRPVRSNLELRESGAF